MTEFGFTTALQMASYGKKFFSVVQVIALRYYYITYRVSMEPWIIQLYILIIRLQFSLCMVHDFLDSLFKYSI